MSIDTILTEFKTQAAESAPLGGTLKFVLDGSSIYVDGSGDNNEVTVEDKAADCVIITSLKNFKKLQAGKMNPMMAVMMGKVKIKGDMKIAMKLQTLLG